ncbi:MAG: hypothetical protein HOH18_00035 [Kordiimonadaceae bacterium]|jgi:hypothetical protein|nr:hypothetical protein [Kordiimonadaceae bacterium]MBT6034837.1 hypothetical protein [Kordiimonadaceae bacterium]
MAKDKAYKFNFSGYVSEEITDQDDYALMKAAEYSLKKGYSYFVLNNTRRFDKSQEQARTGRIGRRQSKKPRLRTELEIHCYDTEQNSEGAYSANSVMQDISQKYSD